MRRPAFLLAAAAALALSLAPVLAEARPGGGIGSGSRGSRTYSAPPPTATSPGTARPMDRTMTPPSQPGQPGYGAAAPRPGMPGAATPARSPLMAGLMGGLLGAGLFGLLAGSGFFGGLSGMTGFLGLLLQIAIIGGLVWLALRLFRGARRPAMAGGPQGQARMMQDQPPAQGMGMGGRPMPAAAPVALQQGDFQAFERILVEVNGAWSRRDLTALRTLATAEMTNYFAQDLRDLDARGWRNETRDLRFEAGDLSEAWNEEGQDYATVAMRFSLLDATFDKTGRVVEGSTTDRQTVTELWTFVRQAHGDRWLLSAIQQTEAAHA